MKQLLFIGVFLFLSQASFCQMQWPVITPQTKPWTRWWWLGSEVNKKDLTNAMNAYQEAGLGGLEITPIYGVQGEESQYIPFLSKAWMEVFDHTLKEAKKLNLGIDVANATGWPFGGPWIGEDDASKNMVYKTFMLNSGESLKDTIQYIQEPLVRTENRKPVNINDLLYPVSTNKNIQSLAIDQIRYKRALPLKVLMAYSDVGDIIDVSNKVNSKGILEWAAPQGKWTLYAVFMGWHGKQVERAAPGGEGNVIDHFSSTALQHYLDRFDKAFKGHDLSQLRAFFNDSYEVDDARGQSNFTPLLFDEFKMRRGYDLKNELPSLFTKTPSDRSNRILCDYRMTLDELILEKFTREWKAWAHQKGKIVRNQSHGSPANTLDLYGVVDIPETEGTEILRIKFAPSTAHVMGKKLAAAESATWLNEHFVSSLSDVKKALDVYFVGGVNHIVYHGTTYSPSTEPWPGRLFYAAVEFDQTNPFWNNFSALNQYVTRTQSFLQRGVPDNDVLLYFPIYDQYAAPGKDLLLHFDGMKPGFAGTGFEVTAQHMMDQGYAFDYISDRQIINLQPTQSKITTGGTSYQTILLPDCKYIKKETFQKLFQLAQSGATILVYKNLPTDVPGYGQWNKNKIAFDELIQKLKFIPLENEAILSAKVGKGQFLLGNDLENLLITASIRKENMTAQGLQFNRRKNATGNEVYFIANNKNKKIDEWVTLNIKVHNAALYNPMTGASGIARHRMNAAGFLEVYLSLNVDESVIVQTSTRPLKGSEYPYLLLKGESNEIKGTWTLQFVDGGPSLPPKTSFDHLKAWTDLDGDDFKTFSGTAIYSIHYERPSIRSNQYLLQLGKVYESAQVHLNGKPVATLIGPNYECILNYKDIKEDNLLEIKVSNSMANRIIDLDKRKVAWKKFNNTNFPSRFKENSGSDGLFNASQWDPRISGLEGPVTITAIETNKSN